MKVHELIRKLQEIRDQEKPVFLSSWSIQEPLQPIKELNGNCLMNQPHRLNILVD